MRTLLFTLSVGSLLASPAAAFERPDYVHTTPPPFLNPLPQGVPYFVDPPQSHAPVVLRYAIVDGRRVLFDPYNGTIVYRLRP